MEFNDYQNNSVIVKSDPARETRERILNAAIGLSGEVGEFNELIKKWAFHGHALDFDRAVKELGDVLWYMASACRALNVDMNTVATTNIVKLKDRYPEGFTTERSHHSG